MIGIYERSLCQSYASAYRAGIKIGEPDYSEERYMLIYAGDRSDDYYGKGYILLEGWHCSCYDWPEVDWDATHYEEDELLKIADMRKRNPSDNAERRFFMLVEQALGAHQ